MIPDMLDDAIRAFDHLIELLQDGGADTDIIVMVEDAREALSDRHEEIDDA